MNHLNYAQFLSLLSTLYLLLWHILYPPSPQLVWGDGASLVAQMVKNLPARRPGFDPWVRKIPWRRERLPMPVFLPGESSWTEEPGRLQSMGLKESDRTERLTLELSFFGEITQIFYYWPNQSWLPTLKPTLPPLDQNEKLRQSKWYFSNYFGAIFNLSIGNWIIDTWASTMLSGRERKPNIWSIPLTYIQKVKMIFKMWTFSF